MAAKGAIVASKGTPEHRYPPVTLRGAAPCSRTTAAPSLREDGTVALLIDPPVWPWRGRRWSHLVSDESYDELHAFVAGELGIPRRAFQGDHYDVPEELHEVAVAAGAEAVSCRELLGRLRAAGLRKPKPHAP
jgi:hypothetical protein